MLNTQGLVPVAITVGVLFAAWKWGPVPVLKGLAMGAAGYMVANNIPVVRDGLHVRVVGDGGDAA